MGDVAPIGSQPGLLAGYSTREQLARKVGRTKHTIRKWEKQGLPVIRRGNLRLYHDETARQWILGEFSGAEPRKPGRPRKTA
jgi:MerR HTH family regulatory protein